MIKILDTGCGEESHLSNIKNKLSPHSIGEVLGVGIDISKEGILVAAKNHANMIWCVADLAHSPLKDSTFDIVLNIFSPSNYGEFQRLLSANGIVIKVIPQSDHLKELRDFFFDDPGKQSYSNQNTIERFNANFETIDHLQLHYRPALDKSLILPLIRMTPLSWNASEEKIQAFSTMDSAEITVDLAILAGKKKII